MDMLLGPHQVVATLHLFRETSDESSLSRDICEGGRLGKHHIPRERASIPRESEAGHSVLERKKKKKKRETRQFATLASKVAPCELAVS